MSRSSTAREALIAEALGDISALVDRLEAAAAGLDANRQALADASAELARQTAASEQRMAALTENAKIQAVRHIARRTDEMTRTALDTQSQAMAHAAQALFRAEVVPALQRLTAPLQHSTDLADRGARPWVHWLTHAATAAVASALTLALATWLGAGRS